MATRRKKAVTPAAKKDRFLVLTSECGNVSQVQYDDEKPTLEAAIKAAKEVGQNEYDDSEAIYVVQIVGVVKKPPTDPIWYPGNGE